MAFKWTRVDIEALIDLIQQYTCIYSVRSKEYMDRSKKAEAFNGICMEMQVKNPALTVCEIKKKWSNLRIQYMAEKRRMVNSKKSGAGANDVLKPRLWCFDQLAFLNCHTELKKSRSNIEDTSINESFLTDRPICIEIEDSSNSSREKRFENAARKKRKSQPYHSFAKDLAVLKGLAENRTKGGKKYAWLGAMVTNQMEDVNIDDQAAACWEVQCVMKKYVLNSQQKKDVTFPVSSPLPRAEEDTADDQDEDMCDMSIEFLFDEDEFNDGLHD